MCGLLWPLIPSHGWAANYLFFLQWGLELLEPLVDVWLRTFTEHCRHCGARAHR